MAKINSSKLIVDNYSTEEVIRYTSILLQTGDAIMAKAISGQNLAYAGSAGMTYTQATAILDALDEKLNGKKQATVV